MLTIPDNAPFSGPQKMWLKGFLAGISAGLPQSGPAETTTTPVAPVEHGIPVSILWGSQTGTAESYAKKLAKILATEGHQPAVHDMSTVTVETMATMKHLFILTSTYGDGEPPDNAAALHASLHSGAPDLSQTSFSIFALGDSNYPEFCKCGHDFQKLLSELGATSLLPIMTSDVDHDLPFKEWSASVTRALVPSN